MINIGEKYIKIDTNNTSLIFCKYSELLEIVYYGVKVKNNDEYDILTSHKRKFGHSCVDDIVTANTTISAYGMGSDRNYSVMILNYDGGIANKFLFKEANIVKKPILNEMPYSKNATETLELVYYDYEYGIKLSQYYSVFKDTDVIAVNASIINESENTFVLNSLMSCQIDLDLTGYNIYTYTGAWARERKQVITHLKEGIFSIDTKCGISSHKVNPFIMLQAPKKMNGYFAFNLAYSGNHKEIVESTSMNTTRVLVGMNDFGFNKKIGINERFDSPEAIMVYATTQNEISQNFHKFINEHVIQERWKQPRPIAVNIWEGTGYNFNHKTIIDYVNAAKELGIELVVIDDGWFGDRKDETSSLGDWYDNESKTGGLKNIADYIRSKGLKFGLWVEPEMISKKSNLFDNHPEYVMSNPLRIPFEQRCQYMLDIVNAEVKDYVYASIEKIITEFSPDYIKWDCNRNMTEAYSKNVKNVGDYFYRYTVSLYNILQRLNDKFPNVLFEGCSAGGGRFDLGILYYMPQIWTSDMTDPVERVKIQESTLIAYPPSALSAHIGNQLSYHSGRKTKLSDRFNVALEGIFGYEFDITKLDEPLKQEIIGQINFYKKYRTLLQYGKYYLIESSYDDNIKVRIVVSSDKKVAIASIYKKSWFNIEPTKYRFCGLDDSILYSITCYKKPDIKYKAYGDILNTYGLDLDFVFVKDKSGDYSTEIYSETFIIEQAL